MQTWHMSYLPAASPLSRVDIWISVCCRCRKGTRCLVQTQGYVIIVHSRLDGPVYTISYICIQTYIHGFAIIDVEQKQHIISPYFHCLLYQNCLFFWSYLFRRNIVEMIHGAVNQVTSAIDKLTGFPGSSGVSHLRRIKSVVAVSEFLTLFSVHFNPCYRFSWSPLDERTPAASTGAVRKA